jgi:heme/copper-type cytochrome/quinol oxidase subunit 2
MNKKVEKSKSWGVASLVLGIIGLLCILAPYFGLPIAILAVIFANKQNKIEPTGQATAGNVLGIIGIIINAIMLLLVLLFVAVFGWASFL